MADPSRRREIFDEDAERYDRARPDYPLQLYDDLVELAGIGPGCRVLEIGCGTGQATVPLAERGCEIVAVELGASLAKIARRKLERFPNADVVTASFEDWPLPDEPFDVVLAATAWHWLDAAVRTEKAATALRPGGSLAIVGTHHVAGGTESFFVDVQACYERWDPETPPGLRQTAAADLAPERDEVDESELFEPVTVRRYEHDIPYTTTSYVDVLLTYSGHRAMDANAQRGLLDCISELIDTRYRGRITKRYLTELRVARRRSA